jgi:hypothetical protein
MDVNGKLHALQQMLYSLQKESLEPNGRNVTENWGCSGIQWHSEIYQRTVMSTLINYKEVIISPLESASTKCYNEYYINTIYKLLLLCLSASHTMRVVVSFTLPDKEIRP